MYYNYSVIYVINVFSLYLQVYEILAEYGISKHQIYTITIDNSSNFIKMTDLLDEDNENFDGN